MVFSLLRSTSGQLLRSLVGAAALAATLLVGCLPSTNPCDPGAPEDLQARVDLAGRVVDQNGDAQPEVTVAVDQTGQTATTNGDGEFQLTDLPPSSSYSLSAYPESPGVGGSITVDNLGCDETRGELTLPIVVPPDAPEVEITVATAPNRMFVAFPSVLPPDDAAQAPMSVARGGGFDPCADELNLGDPRHRYWLEVRSPFGTWQRALLNPDPLASKHAHGSFDLSTAYESLGEACLRSTCGYYTYQFSDLADYDNARCTEVVGFVDDNDDKHTLLPFATYQVRVRTDELISDDTAQAGSLPSAVTSTPSAAPDRLSLTPTATLPVPLSLNADDDTEQRAALDVSNIVPVADGRFALVESGGLIVVGSGSVEAQERNGVDADAAASQSSNGAEVEGGMFYDDVTSEDTQAEVSAGNATAIDLLPAGKWVRVLKRQGDGTTMIDKVWVGDSWGTAPADDDSPTQPVFSMDVNTEGLGDQFIGFRWLGGIEGDPTDPTAPYNPPDAYLLLFEDGVAMLEAVEAGVSGGDTYMSEAAGSADSGQNPGVYEPDPVNPPPDNGSSMCDAMDSAVGNSNTGGLTAYGACFDMNRVLSGVQLTDVEVLQTSEGAFETYETLHLFSDASSDRVFVVLSDHLLAKNLPADVQRPADAVTSVPVGIEPVALQPSYKLTCDGLTELAREPVMLVANRGSQDISVLERVDYAEGLPPETTIPNPRYGAEEIEVVGLPIVPTGFFGDLGGPTCEGPYSWVVGEGGEMMPIDMRTLDLPPCKDGPCQVATRSRARAGAISRDQPGNARVLIGGQGVLSEVGYLLPSPVSSFGESGMGQSGAEQAPDNGEGSDR